VTSHDRLIHLFERIQFFLDRLKIYSGIPLTNELGKLLGSILTELLSVLALSTKEMTDWPISKLIQSLCTFPADYCTELFFMRLLKRDDVGDALSRLDILTKYSLIMLARNLARTQILFSVVVHIPTLFSRRMPTQYRTGLDVYCSLTGPSLIVRR